MFIEIIFSFDNGASPGLGFSIPPIDAELFFSIVLIIAGACKAFTYIPGTEFGEFGRGALIGLAMQIILNTI